MVVCGDCGISLDHLPSLATGGKALCPQCGSSKRKRLIDVAIGHNIEFQDHDLLKARRNGKDNAFRESVRTDGHAAVADRHPDGRLSSSIVGGSTQNEDSTLEVCQLLVKKLNAQGASWGAPVKPEQVNEVDAVAEDLKDPRKKLLIQVTRAIHGPSTSRALHKGNAVAAMPADLADRMMGAIADKSLIPPKQKAELTLALDATLLPAVLFEDVLEAFTSRHGPWALQQGFQAIWLVGPPYDQVVRLDRQ